MTLFHVWLLSLRWHFPGLILGKEHFVELECWLVPIEVQLWHFHEAVIHVGVWWNAGWVLYLLKRVVNRGLGRWW